MSFILRRQIGSASLFRVAAPRSTTLLPRTYASTTKGGDTTNPTSLSTPSPKSSDSTQEGDIKSSRATDGRAPEQGGSVSQPISEANQTKTGQDEEGQDPAKEMGADIAKQGGKPLDAADK